MIFNARTHDLDRIFLTSNKKIPLFPMSFYFLFFFFFFTDQISAQPHYWVSEETEYTVGTAMVDIVGVGVIRILIRPLVLDLSMKM